MTQNKTLHTLNSTLFNPKKYTKRKEGSAERGLY